MSFEGDAKVIDMGAYIGRKAHQQNMAYIRRVQATHELEPYYRACERLAELGGRIIDMAMPAGPNLQLVVSEDQQ